MKNLTIVMISAMAFILSCSKSSTTTTTTGTVPQIATASTSDITAITQSSASFSATITSDGSSSVTVKGVCWSTSHNPTTSDSKTTNRHGSGTSGVLNKVTNLSNTSFIATITGLNASTTYYVRVYATNSSGTAYSNEVSFTTTGAGNTVTDVDGNVYHTIVIGTQTWMLENLKVTKYRNGNSIPSVTVSSTWKRLSTGAYTDYWNDTAHGRVYGHLYNWYAVNDSRLLAPAGWHIPSQAEWNTLYSSLGGVSVAGSKLKEAGNTHWNDNGDASNSSGWTGLPGGTRSGDTTVGNDFYDTQEYGYWWYSTQVSATKATALELSHYFAEVDPFDVLKTYGYSVRCIKD